MDNAANIKSIKTQSKCYRVTVTMNNGNTYYTEFGICKGVEAHSIIKQVPGYNSLHSKVYGIFILKRLMKLYEKSKTKANNLFLGETILNLYNQYLPDAKDSDRTFPTATTKEYQDKLEKAKNNNAHWLDGIKSIGFGKRTYSVKQLKKDGIV
jgi:hypothetical protein